MIISLMMTFVSHVHYLVFNSIPLNLALQRRNSWNGVDFLLDGT